MPVVFKHYGYRDTEVASASQYHNFFRKPSAIQQSGFMLVFKDLRQSPIVVSDNIKHFLPSLLHLNFNKITSKDLQILRLDELFSSEDVTRLYQTIALSVRQRFKAQVTLKIKHAGFFYCYCHRDQVHNYFEFVPVSGQSKPELRKPQLPDFEYLLSKLHLTAQELQSQDIPETNPLIDLCRFFVDEIQEYTDFDSVRLHRFMPDWSSEVLAEASTVSLPLTATASLTADTGLFYPEHYFPLQFRVQCQKFNSWFIYDTARTSSALIHCTDNYDCEQDRFYTYSLDLSQSLLRAAPQEYLEQLKSRDIGCLLILPLHIKGDLWGLLVCACSRPRDFDFQRRQQLEIIGQQFIQAIMARLDIVISRQEFQIDLFFKQLTYRHQHNVPLNELLIQNCQWLLDLCQAQGLYMQIGVHQTSFGLVPQPKQMSFLQTWVATVMEAGIIVSDNVSRLLPDPSFQQSKIAGFMVVGFNTGLKESPSVLLMWFREACPREIQSIYPSDSDFQGGFSLPWNCYHQSAARIVLNRLSSFLLPLYFSMEKTNNQMKYKIEELNYMMKHVFVCMKKNRDLLQTATVNNPDQLQKSMQSYLAGLNAQMLEMTLLLDEMLHFSKRGIQSIEVDALHLAEAMEEVVKSCQLLSCIQIKQDIFPAPLIFASRLELEMVLLIVISFLLKRVPVSQGLYLSVQFNMTNDTHAIIEMQTQNEVSSKEVDTFNRMYGPEGSFTDIHEIDASMMTLRKLLTRYDASLFFESSSDGKPSSKRMLAVMMTYPLDVRNYI